MSGRLCQREDRRSCCRSTGEPAGCNGVRRRTSSALRRAKLEGPPYARRLALLPPLVQQKKGLAGGRAAYRTVVLALRAHCIQGTLRENHGMLQMIYTV